MKSDTVKQFLALRQSLEKEKAALQERVAQIDEVLGCEATRVGTPWSGPMRGGRTWSKARRPRNRMSLRQAVIEVTKNKPLTKAEIMEAIGRLGYQFAAKNPINSLNTVLYTRKQFKNSGGRFSPAR